MRSAIVLLAAMVTFLLGSSAHAGELQFGVIEREDGVTLQVRGFEGEPKQVVTSRTGMLFFFDGSKAKTVRLRPTQKHRIAYAQVGQTGSRVALRIAQRERARGALGTFVTTQSVPGGIDIDIVDRHGSAEADEADEAAIAQQGKPIEEQPADRGAALAALEASLGGEPPRAKAETDAPKVDDEEEEEEAVAAIAPAIDPPTPSVEPETEPAPSTASSSSGLRSVLAVALLLAFGGGAMWWIKRRKHDASAPALDVVSRVGIGPKQSVVLINAGGRQLLIGATEKRIEVLTEIGTPTAELRVPSAIDRAREPFGAALHPALRAPVAPPSDPTAPAKVAAFKARLEQALGRELTGEHPLHPGARSSGEHAPFGKPSLASAEHARVDDSTPAHLRLLQNDPRWGHEEGLA